jgi:hypothetical protein
VKFIDSSINKNQSIRLDEARLQAQCCPDAHANPHLPPRATALIWNIRMPVDTIASFLSTATSVDKVTVLLTILNLAATVSITVVLNISRKKSETMQNTQFINKQWQDFNKTMIESPAHYENLRQIGYESGSDDEIKNRHILYYILNLLYDTWRLAKANAIDREFALLTIKGQLSLLIGARHQLVDILSNDCLYEDHFRRHCLAVLAGTAR